MSTTTASPNPIPLTGNIRYSVEVFGQNALLDVQAIVPGGQEVVMVMPTAPNPQSWLLIPNGQPDEYAIQTRMGTTDAYLSVVGNLVFTTTSLAAATTWNIIGDENAGVDVMFNNDLLTAPGAMGTLLTVTPRTGNNQKWKFTKNVGSTR